MQKPVDETLNINDSVAKILKLVKYPIESICHFQKIIKNKDLSILLGKY